VAFNLSSSPHVRSSESTRSIMWDVSLALLPATAFGIVRFGWYSLLVVLVSIAFAVLSEYMYQNITKQRVLISDGSAFLTGLLLGLNMPPSVPLWLPALGSMFAVIFVKQFFGGLGRNFMNPALGGRCFLLISFTSLMSTFYVDGVSTATPLAALRAGDAVDVWAMFFGFTGGVIGEVSTLALLIGGIYLVCKRIISWIIPVVYIATFAVFMFFFGAQAFDPMYVLAQVCGGGLMLGAWFMATDYVTSPPTKKGKVIFAVLLGLLTGIFRTFGATAEGVSYAIIFCNLLVPLIEKISMPKAFGLEKEKKEKAPKAEATEEAKEETEKEPKAPISLKAYHAALNLTVIALIVGLLLGAAYELTKTPIKNAEMAEEAAAYAAVCPQAVNFDKADNITELAATDAATLTSKFGKVVIESAYKALDKSGNVNGYIVNVTTKEGFGGAITVTIGMDEKGVITGIAFLAIDETAGLGMNAKNESFYGQYIGKDVKEFTVVKTGSTADNEIDAIGGATITSKAVTNAVNAALYLVDKVAE